MSVIYSRVDVKEAAIIAYSGPGSTNYILATIREAEVINEGQSLEAYDYIVAPFDKSLHSRIGIHIASYAASMKFDCYPQGQMPSDNTSPEEYNSCFEKAITTIEAKELKKIVISRVKNIYNDVENIYPLFVSLKNKYPSSYTFLIHIPNWGTWMGSTPELLIKSANHGYTSRAVAGTRPSTDKTKNWTSKEIEEHRYIETYLKESLSKVSVEHAISPTFDLEAGPVTHICSDIKINSTSQLDNILDIIHPGPALSGMPRNAAIQKISEIELHDRRYYCGYLGRIESPDKLEFYAMIRCMQVYKNGYRLYLGGGITADSELQKEWKETNLKAETLLSVLEEKKAINE